MVIAREDGDYTVATHMTAPEPCKVYECVSKHGSTTIPHDDIGVHNLYELLTTPCVGPLYSIVSVSRIFPSMLSYEVYYCSS